MSTADDIINHIYKEFKGKIGLFCLNCLFMRTSFKELNEFVYKKNIAINKNTKTKTGYLKEMAVHFHHVFDEKGENLLTNGPDGENPYTKKVTYPHHRGLYIGWNKLQFEGETYDTWHMSNGVRQVHQ